VESKLRRLINLVAALLSAERPRTREEIREDLRDYYASENESFRRTFERDKDELRAMGIPLLVQAVPGTDPQETGYRIDRKQYAGQAPKLSSQELAALHLANYLVRLGDSSSDGLFWKLGGYPGSDGVESVARLPEDPALSNTLLALADRRVMVFNYGGSERLVEPHCLAFRNGNWHLKGKDRTRKEERQFRVDRMEKVACQGDPEAFDFPTSFSQIEDGPAWRYGDEDEVLVRVAVDAPHVPWVSSYLGKDRVVLTQSDGSAVFEEVIRNWEAFRSFLLTFLDGAEILSPSSLRGEFVDWLQEMA